jgi:hypothetical protein
MREVTGSTPGLDTNIHDITRGVQSSCGKLYNNGFCGNEVINVQMNDTIFILSTKLIYV